MPRMRGRNDTFSRALDGTVRRTAEKAGIAAGTGSTQKRASKSDAELFCPLPTRAIGDRHLSALDLRVLACIAKYDRRSLPTGKGRGCIASQGTMAEELGCDPTSLSKSIRTLLAAGYLVSERQNDARLRVYRVDYATDSWSIGQQSPAPEAGETWRNGQQSGADTWPIGGDAWPNDPEIVDLGKSETTDFKDGISDKREGKEKKRYATGDFDAEESSARRGRTQPLRPAERDGFRRRIIETWQAGDDDTRTAISHRARVPVEIIDLFCRGERDLDDGPLAIVREACLPFAS
jgi:DNA-binding MarR family transcriptional regulator